jgi:hypothetical protein
MNTNHPARRPGRPTRTWTALAAAAALAALVVGGCGGDDDPSPTDPVTCSITDVSTGNRLELQSGDTVTIEWGHTGTAAQVRIDLLDGDTVVDTVADATANDGRYFWTIAMGDLPSGDAYAIEITALGTDGCSGRKTGLSILNIEGCAITPAPVESDYPGAFTDTLYAGDPYTIGWSAERSGGALDIELWYMPPGAPDEFIAVIVAGVDANAGSHVWDPVDSFNYKPNEVSHNNYAFRFVDTRADGCEAVSNLFRIDDDDVCTTSVSGFTEGAVFDEGDVVTLNLAQSGGSGAVNLRLYANGELVATEGGGYIAEGVAANAGYPWTVNDFGHDGGSNNYQIRAFDPQDPYCEGFSVRFTIMPGN